MLLVLFLIKQAFWRPFQTRISILCTKAVFECLFDNSNDVCFNRFIGDVKLESTICSQLIMQGSVLSVFCSTEQRSEVCRGQARRWNTWHHPHPHRRRGNAAPRYLTWRAKMKNKVSIFPWSKQNWAKARHRTVADLHWPNLPVHGASTGQNVGVCAGVGCNDEMLGPAPYN